jgi:flagellar biosynthesis protein FlhB
MADQNDSQEKTEDATPKRVREARKKGQVPKSKDMNTVVILVVCLGALGFMAKFMSEQLSGLMVMTFEMVAKPELVFEDLVPVAAATLMTWAKVMGPFLLAVVVSSAAVTFLQVGPIFSMDPITPEPKKLNAVENLKNMFKMVMVIELAKNVIKMAAIFILAFTTIKGYLTAFLLTSQADLTQTANLAGLVLFKFLIKVLILFLLVAIVDIMLQRKEFMKNMKMSKDEVKREYKEDEGDPMIKGQRKQLHQEMAMNDAKGQVQNSDVVVTNPTHIAVAIKYDPDDMVAPQIMLKGQRLFAQTIREIAEEEGIPIMRNVPLAWALIELEVGDDIPEDLYQAVAEILTFVYRLKEEQAGRGTPSDESEPAPVSAPSRLGETDDKDSKFV